jgi:hypothetical protein
VSRLLDIVDEMTARNRGLQGGTARERFMAEHGLDDEGYAYYIRHNVFPPKGPPLRIVRFDEPSPIVPGRRGLSREALALFGLAQKAGGDLTLSPAVSRRMRARVADLRPLVDDELEAFGLATRVGEVVVVSEGFENAVVFDHGWSRWGL